jgi:uncharacterized protein
VRIVETFAYPVREIDNAWIPLPGGDRLAARLWLPETPAPVPAVLEYIPYRKRDFTSARDEPMHRYFAGHGIAAMRVDMRGSGDSDGLLLDEYLQQELDDGAAVIAWLAAQPWCNGNVGMMGNSWGGFNALQVAALRPPALKAIITSCSTDDRYADDMHYAGGCLLNDNVDWGTTFFSLLPRSPDPALVGDRWREIWLRRLEATVEPIGLWMRHQRRDAFWKHGSVCEDYGRIQCAVLAVGGWLDGYSNAIPRMLEHLRSPRRGIIGPWAHMYPHMAVPGPGIGFLQLAVRWWRHWLKGEDTGVMDEPMLLAHMGEAVPAAPFYPDCPGRWIAEAQWPSPNVRPRTWHLGEGRLATEPSEATSLSVRSPETTGLAGGEWCPYGTGGQGPEFPGDQREDDGRSLVFDSSRLKEPVEILGAPVATLTLRADRSTAFVAVRLCDVAPDGASTRVSYGVLNLSHRESHEHLLPVAPGEKMQVRVKLSDAAYAFQAGHRIRLAISTAYWPLLWPAPEPVTLTVETGSSSLALPARATVESTIPPLGAPESGPPSKRTTLKAGSWENRIDRDVKTGTVTVSSVRDDGLARLESNGLEIGTRMEERMSIRDGDPLSAETEMARSYSIGRGGWRTRIDARAKVTATGTAFRVTAALQAYEGDALVFERTWDEEIPRDGV